MNGGHGYQFTPFGILPLGAAPPALGDVVSGGTAEVPRPADGPQAATTQVTRDQGAPAKPAVKAAAGFDPKKPITGRQIVSQARARVREIDRTLRKVDDLRAERASLSALIAAATTRKTDA